MIASVKSLLSNKKNDPPKKVSKSETIEPPHKKILPKKNDLPLFDPDLVKDLENDHQEILLEYQDVLQCAENRDFEELPKQLETFSSKLINHIRKEDEELYLYMKSLASYNGSIEEKVCGEFVAEMKKITISMFYTLSQSPNVPVNDQNVEQFIEEFKGLGKELQDRIIREERIIYPMYENSRKHVDAEPV